MNFCLYPFIFFGPDRRNVRVVRRNVRNIRSLFVSRSLVFSFQRKIVNVCFPVDGHKYPNVVQFDEGKEFYNVGVRELLKSRDVDYFSTHSDKKAAIVERFNI